MGDITDLWAIFMIVTVYRVNEDEFSSNAALTRNATNATYAMHE